MRSPHQIKRLLSLIAVAICALSILSGCSVLTPSQVKEANRFALATQNYKVLPGAVTEAHIELRKQERIMTAAGFLPGDMAIRQIESSLKGERDQTALAQKANRALSILNNYSQLLVVLSSDKFTASLQEEAEDLGSQLDKGVKLYNESYGGELSGIGGILAGGIRGIGGIFIKSKQSKALKKAISDADPIIEKLTVDVNDYLSLYITSASKPGYILETEQSIKRIIKKDLNGTISNSPLFSAIQAAEAFQLSYDAQQLAIQAKSSIEKLRRAHADLKKGLKKKKKLDRAIESVRVFADEVKAAVDLKKQLDD